MVYRFTGKGMCGSWFPRQATLMRKLGSIRLSVGAAVSLQGQATQGLVHAPLVKFEALKPFGNIFSDSIGIHIKSK